MKCAIHAPRALRGVQGAGRAGVEFKPRPGTLTLNCVGHLDWNRLAGLRGDVGHNLDRGGVLVKERAVDVAEGTCGGFSGSV